MNTELEVSPTVQRMRQRKALQIAVAEEINSRLEHGPIGDVKCCECNVKEWVGGMFKCFFCLSWFCQTCGEKHFGKTREDYWNEKKSVS